MSEKIFHNKKLGESTAVLKFCILRGVSASTALTTPVFLRSILLKYELLLYCFAGLVRKSLEGKLFKQNFMLLVPCIADLY